MRKTSRITKVRQEETYLTIDYFKDLGHPIMVLCDILEIPRSSYYKRKNRSKPKKETQDEEICNLILEYDKTFQHILGYRRMTMFINHFNRTDYSVGYIHRLMKILGVKAKIRRCRPGYRKSKPEYTAENILARDFSAAKPNEKWLSDVTEFKIIGQKQKLFLCAIFDLYDNSIIAYKMSTRNDNKLVFDTFDLAIKKHPNAKPIFHSDRGYQYTSIGFKTKIKKQGIIQSMSRVGKCIDNGPMEAFWGIIKSEMYYLNKFYSLEDLKQAIINYINFYNHKRLQGKLKCLPPIEYRKQALIA
ncbi:MAG: IS3 family transposase [Bacilli bacterium]